MITSIQLHNFKCFQDKTFHLRNLTVLAGSNSVGKSTFIQAILLARVTSDKLMQFSIIENSLASNLSILVPLNGPYLLTLGNTLEVLTNDADSNEITIIIKDIFNNEIYFPFKAVDNKSDCYNLILQDKWIQKGDLEIIKNEFYYLNAERLGPRLTYEVDQLDYKHVGWQGEYTIQILAQNKEELIENYTHRKFCDSSDFKLLNQVKEWMNYIIPNSYIDEADLNGKIKKAYITYSKSSPPNVGFGISYVLPIIVNALLAKANSLFIVENPEAHLHPKGQSNMGYFLAQIASSGVQVIIETHSEHIINGIRRFILSTENLLASGDILINFFDGFDISGKANIKEINLLQNGDLSSFPRDFFDQVQQDLAKIFQLRRGKNNG